MERAVPAIMLIAVSRLPALRSGIFVFAILGGLLGKAVLKKHFVKAGIA